MHELGLAEGIFDIVRQHVSVDRAGELRTVTVRVGDLAGVLPESLSWCFEVVVAGTQYAEARLAIERVPAELACTQCGQLVPVSALIASCPGCSGPLTVTRGWDLQVVTLDLDETHRTDDVEGKI
jgi:hydrogenase nickel incorporation protein HypA/HybF